jgi:hypothetical protein
LARELECSAQGIRNRAASAATDCGKRIARQMRCGGNRAVGRQRGFLVTTRRDARQRPAADLVNREFGADGPDRLWVADMTRATPNPGRRRRRSLTSGSTS